MSRSRPRLRGKALPGSAESLDHVIHTRVSSEALGMLEERARGATVTMSTVVRRLVYKGLGLIDDKKEI